MAMPALAYRFHPSSTKSAVLRRQDRARDETQVEQVSSLFDCAVHRVQMPDQRGVVRDGSYRPATPLAC